MRYLKFTSWQDMVIGIGGFLLAPALVPMILAAAPPPLSSSVLTAAVLWAFMLSFASLGLRLSTVSTFITATMWTVLALQGLSII